MQRVLVLVPLALAAAVLAAPSQSAKRSLTFRVKLIQEQTVRHHSASAGADHAGDTFSTQLRLFAIGKVLGFPDKTPMGTMAFDWGPLEGNCSTSGSGCDGTTTITTVTRLPGGTLSAGGKNVSLSKGIVVPIENGTGIFKGASGSIQIAPASVAEDVFTITLPG